MSSQPKKKRNDVSTQKLRQKKICFTTVSRHTSFDENTDSNIDISQDIIIDNAGSSVTEIDASTEGNPKEASSSCNSEASDEVMIPDSPFHPPKGYKFPATIQGKQKRYCQAHWFEDNKDGFAWLHYDLRKNAVFCFPCMKQNNQNRLTTVPKKEKAFISSWKDALGDFRKHQASECHSISITYEYIVPKCGNAREMNSEKLKTTMIENCKCFLKIMESLQYLSRQGIAVQGKTDAESNFMQLLHLRTKDYKPLKKWLETMNDTYTSRDIQNEILNLMSHVIRSLVSDMKREMSLLLTNSR